MDFGVTSPDFCFNISFWQTLAFWSLIRKGLLEKAEQKLSSDIITNLFSLRCLFSPYVTHWLPVMFQQQVHQKSQQEQKTPNFNKRDLSHRCLCPCAFHRLHCINTRFWFDPLAITFHKEPLEPLDGPGLWGLAHDCGKQSALSNLYKGCINTATASCFILYSKSSWTFHRCADIYCCEGAAGRAEGHCPLLECNLLNPCSLKCQTNQSTDVLLDYWTSKDTAGFPMRSLSSDSCF